jgi:beta-N-acetylhexosaminidase
LHGGEVMSALSAVILGLEATQLSDVERGFFRELNPMGYILFARNCDTPNQLRALTDSLRELSGDAKLPILIDQEGGRVARLRPPHWRKTLPAQTLAACAPHDLERAKRAMYVSMRLIADELYQAGITVNCAPIADVPVPQCHDVIGDRALGDTPEQVAQLARIQTNALLDGGVLPVLKHIPGHGRGLADSHLELPTVTTSLGELRKTDFMPFKLLNDLPFGMTAHIRYTAIDADQPATLSPAAIALIRDELSFDGLLMSDDASMKALSGGLEAIARDALAAGCDVVLHCNGKMDEMVQIAKGVRALDVQGLRRLDHAKAMLQAPKAWDELAMLDEYNALVA